jgi:two-component system nitrogen regulation response regulator GlnG
MDFDFPGNVRQLENICHWLTVMAPSQVIEAKDLPPEVGQASAPMSVESSAPGLPIGPMATLATAAAMSAPAAGGTSAAVAEVVRPEGLAWSMAGLDWLAQLEAEARRRLEGGEGDVWQALTDQFEARLIETALDLTRGRRIEAAQRLGIGRNTITRKIDELGLDRKRGPA